MARPRDFDWRQVDSDCMDGTFNNLHTFVQFVGYPRSGHTLVAMLLDAHPNIVISNEYNILEKWYVCSIVVLIFLKKIVILEKRKTKLLFHKLNFCFTNNKIICLM